MEDNKRKLYDALSDEFDLGTYEEFERNIGDSVKRQKLYDAASADYDLGDFESYSQKIGPTHRENLESFTAEHGSFLNDFEARDTAETKRMMASARSGAYMPSENAVSGEERQKYMELHKQEEALKKAWFTSDEYLAQKDADALFLSNISKSINKESMEFAQANPVLRQEGAFQINPYATRGAEADTELEKYRMASRIMDDAIKIHNAPSRYDGKNVFLKFGRGAGDILSDADFWTAGLTEIADNFGVRSVLKSVQDKLGNLNDLSEESIENILSPAEKAVLQAWAINAQEQLKRKDDLSRAYQAGQGATESLGFMAEFALTGGVGKLASEGVESMAKWLSKKAMTTVGGMADDVAEKVLRETGEKIAKSTVGKYGTRLAESLAEAAGRTGVMPSTFRNISEKATEINTDEEGNNYLVGMNNAFAKGFADSFIENLSEGGRVNALGELIGDVAGKIPAYRRMVDKFSNTKASELLDAFNSSGIMNALRAGGWHGLGEEYLEEWYGNALRTLTGVDKEALKEFATVDNQIVTITSFLPMTIFGGTVGTAQVLSASRDLEKKSAALKSALLERGYDEAQANNMIDMMRGSTPAEVSEFLSPIVNSVAGRSVDEAAALMKPVGEFAAAVRRWQAFDTKYKYQEQEQRDNLRTQMEETLGQFWQEDENGRQTVQRGVNASGESVYLLGKPSAEEAEAGVSAEVAAITSDGRKVFVNPSDYELDDELEMNDFLGTEIMAEKGNKEQARMIEERETQNAAIREAAVPGTAINIGTEEAPVQAIVIQRNPDGVIVNTPDGQARQMTLEEFGNYVGINAVPMTDAQIEEQEADVLSAERAQREAALDQEYSNEESTYEEIAEAEDEIEQATEAAEALPLKADGSVDQTALWNQDPERWAQWNDEQRQDGGVNSLAYINGAIAKESARIAEMQAGYDAISDFDERDAVEREVVAVRERLQRLVNLRDGYVAQAEAAQVAAEEAEVEQVAPRIMSQMGEKEMEQADAQHQNRVDAARSPRARREALQNYINELSEGSESMFIISVDDYEEVMSQRGCTSRQITQVRAALAAAKLGRYTVPAFFVPRVGTFAFQENIQSVEEARLSYVHERQHKFTRDNNAYVNAILNLGLSRERMAQIVHAMSNSDFYKDDSAEVLADEIISYAMERAYTYEDFSVALQELGIEQEIIDIITNIDNEQRNEDSTYPSRRRRRYDLHDNQSNTGNGTENDRNQESVSGGLLGSQGDRSLGDSNGRARSTGEGAEVISEEQLNAPNSGEPQQITAEDGEVIADTNGKGGVRFSIRTWLEGGRNYLAAWLDKDETLTAEEKTDILARMDEFYENAQKYTDTYVPFGRWSEAAVRYDSNGNPLMSVIKANGDYAMNLDFSLVCKKRRPLNRLLRTLINRNAFGTYSLKEREIAEINWILQEHGFEVACALCFVDSKRYRVSGVADVFAALYNKMVKALAPEGTPIAHFNYNNNPNVEVVENGIDTLADDLLNWDNFEKYASRFKPTSVEGKVAQFLRDNPSQRRLVDATDFIEAEGFEAVKANNQDLLKLYNAKKGTGGPKASFGDVQYLNDILKKEKSFDVDKAYSVGGVRIQSFSDFVPHMYFDYMQLFAELAAKKLPAHAYTKEVLFAKIFGLTGLKINLSLVPAVVDGGVAPGLDAEGNYAWADAVRDPEGNVIQQAQSFPFEEAMAIQNAPGYSRNCGAIAVGISDEHIEKMLDDPNIQFIIPYHKSSLNAIVARMTNIDQYKDYTNVQTTKKASGTKLDKDTKDFNFNEHLHNLGENGTPQQAAQEYLDWCRENNFRPKFSQFAYHPNYYKLLVDFNTIDTTTDEYAPQGAVTMSFPTEQSAFGNVEALIEQGLGEDMQLEEKMEAEVDAIADEVEARLEEISKEPKLSEKQQLKKMAELADERAAQVKAKAGGIIDLVEEARKAQKKHDAKVKKGKKSDVSFRVRGENESAVDFCLAVANDIKAKYRIDAKTRVAEVNEKNAKVLGYEDGVINDIAVYLPDYNMIVIFAHEELDNSLDIECAVFHEINHKYYDNPSLGDWLWEYSDGVEYLADLKREIIETYSKRGFSEAEQKEELYCETMAQAMSLGTMKAFYEKLPQEYKATVDKVLNETRYDKEREFTERIRRSAENNSGAESGSSEFSGQKQESNGLQSGDEKQAGEDATRNDRVGTGAGTRFRVTEITPEVQDELDTIKASAIVIGNYMKAPNGADTNLTAEQWAIVRTENFKAWFGDWENDPENASKVVDENGEPMVVYHGTQSKFTAFDVGYKGKNFGFRLSDGFYFSPDKTVAESYASFPDELKTGEVKAVFLNIINPFHIKSAKDYREQIKEIASLAARGNRYQADLVAGMSESELLSQRGYDGVVEKRTDGVTGEIVVFDPNQIKSATDNTGVFSVYYDIRFRIRTKPAPEKTGIGYKVFYLKDGKLYPPMVANQGGVDTPVGVWLDAEEGTRAGKSKTGRPKVKQGGKGTQGGSGTLAYRPGWHLGEIPYAIQFNRKDENENRTLFPADFVWAEVEYANDIDYQEEAMSYGMNANGKFQHSLAGLPKLPTDGSYRYRTNPNPETDPWIITGAMKVNRLLTPSEVDQMVVDAGREPQRRQEGAVTDEQIEALNESFDIRYRVNENPTDAQKEAGNYKMGHLNLDGYKITIENPKGSVRRGTDSNGNVWENTLNNDYGYIRGTEGVDGDHIDVYLSDNPSEGNVFVVDQVNPHTREFDEHKVMYGFNSAEEAREAYLANFSEGWNGLGTITEVTKDEFKKWIESSHRKTKPFSEYKSVKAIGAQSEAEEAEDDLLPSTGTPTDEVVASGLDLSPAQTAELAGNIFAALPEDVRKKITDGLNGNILGLQDAILQIPTSLATKENWNDEDGQMAEVVAEQMTKAIGKEMTRPFSASEALWTLYNAVNKSTDLVSEASRALVRRNLGFDSQTLEMEDGARDGVRFRTVGDASANAQASMYNRGAVNVRTRLKESFVDMHASVEKLVKAIEKKSGKIAQGFENVLMALNQQSSKGLAAMEAYEQKFLNKMFDEIRAIMNKTDFRYEDIVRYVILKHGLERNIKLAQRDAKAHYQEIYDDIIAKINGMNPAQKRTYLTNAQLRDADAKAEIARLQAVNTSSLTPDQLRDHKKELAKAKKEASEAAEHLVRAQKIATMTEQDALDELDKTFKKIEKGTDSVYKEMRKNDYSGISSMFYDTLGVDRKNYATEEEYQSALMQAKADKYDTLGDIEGAAQMEVTLFENEVNTDNLWKSINAATKETLRQQYEANMISKDQYDNLRNMFEFYVPLRGFKDNTAEDMYTYYRRPNSTGYTKPILGAEGRKTEAESPFGWIAAMAGSAIASNVKNEAKLALYYFVANRPDNGVATLSRTWFVHTPGDVDANGKKIFRPAYPPFNEDLSTDAAKQAYEDWQDQMRDLQKQGLAYEAGQRLNLGNSVVNISDTNKPEHIVNVKVGGKDYTIVINGNPRAAQAINGDLNIESSAQDYSTVFGPMLRWMSSVNTSYNPEFWITNMMRDMAFTMMAVNIKEDPAYRRKFKKNYAKAFKVISMVAKNEKGTLGNSYIENMYKDFVKYGGVTGYTQIKDSETWEKEIENYLTSNDPASIRNGKVMRGMKSAFHAAHRFGESLEQVSRFAAFLTAVETGKSINEAINDAKEITVNFNRKGSGKMITLEEAKYLTDKNGQPLNKLEQWAAVGFSSIAPLGRRFIMFFNAAIQGLNATYKLYAKNKIKAIGWALGYAAVGMMNAVLHAMLDDDDDYLDIPQYERRTSLMIGGNGAYFKWALPQEARAFYALGDLAVESVMGRNPQKWYQKGSTLGQAIMISTEILPINPVEGWKAFMPSAAVPVVELALNEDYKGSPIYNEQKWLSEEEKKRSTKWSKAYSGTGDMYIGIAKVLNAVTGGDEHDAGLINLQPEKMEHIVQSAFGGTIRTADKFINTIAAAIDPEEDVTIRQTPFLNRFLTINDERYRNVHVNDVYDYYSAEAEHTIRLEKQYTKDRNADALKDLKSSDEYKWARIYSKYKKPIKKYQEKIKAAEGTAERMELMKQQDELKRKMIKEISEL